MATSGSSDFNLNMAEVTEEAYERCGLELRTGYDARTARRSLNLLFAEWSNRGLNLWTVEEIIQTVANLSTTSGVSAYPIGTITMTVAASGAFTIGETITGSGSGATAKIITKPSTTTMTLTIPSGTFLTTDTITGGTSGATTTVTTVPSLEDAKATVDVLEMAVRRDNADTVVSRVSRGDYLAIANKEDQGRVTEFYVDRLITPVLHVWPVPENSTDQLVYYRVKRMQDIDAAVNDADIPFRFLPCLVAGLAYYIAIKKAPDRVQLLKSMYDEEFYRAAGEDAERVGLRLVPSYPSLRVL
tara:strand:+ start:361 stop:1263 length:903 start_codon:yes stop_codon:yes gene_type:complete